MFVYELTPRVVQELSAMVQSLTYLWTLTLDYMSPAYSRETLPTLTDASQLETPEFIPIAGLANAIIAHTNLVQINLNQPIREYRPARFELKWLECGKEICCTSPYGSEWCNDTHHPIILGQIEDAEKPYPDWLLHDLCDVLAWLCRKQNCTSVSLFSIQANLKNYKAPEAKDLPIIVSDPSTVTITRL